MEPIRVLKSEVAPGIHQGKWGFYPTDYEHYQLLKQLNKHFTAARAIFCDYLRWDCKLPHNRVLRKWKRNEKGQKIGCEIVGPKPDPRLRKPQGYLEVFPSGSQRVKIEHRGPTGGVIGTGYIYKTVLCDLGIEAAYQNARMPVAGPELVQPLPSMMTKDWCRMILRRLGDEMGGSA